MKCERCDGKGYVEYVARRDGKDVPLIQQCCDIAKYSAAIKARYMPEVPPAQPVVIPFRGKNGRED